MIEKCTLKKNATSKDTDNYLKGSLASNTKHVFDVMLQLKVTTKLKSTIKQKGKKKSASSSKIISWPGCFIRGLPGPRAIDFL